MKNLFYLIVFSISFIVCSCSQGSNDYIPGNDYNSNVKTYVEQIAESIVDGYHKRAPLIAQDLGVDNISIDSLVLIKDYEEPYNGYFITRVTKNNVTKKVYFKVNNITTTDKYIKWEADFTMPENVAFDIDVMSVAAELENDNIWSDNL